MEMILVNRFSYPPVTLVDEDDRNQLIGKEVKLSMVRLFLKFSFLNIRRIYLLKQLYERQT